jgi:hypothetical protein
MKNQVVALFSGARDLRKFRIVGFSVIKKFKGGEKNE